jgi:tetratricopeptide (TPR) repeat protein
MKSTRAVVLCLFLMTLIAALVYLPGLTGGFLFDDYPNLDAMGHLGGVTNWETFKAFVLSGWSGPTGRPLSLASFLLDDNTWPSSAPLFKQTNLLIHLLCGLLLCWVVLLLMRNMKAVTEEQAQWIAVLGCSFWLLHPYMVSTTFYVVQRMAQLAALFSLLGILIYLQARLKLQDSPKHAYLGMTFAIGIGTLLATFSKENGALLPLLILVIECCMPKQGKPAWQWRALCLWLPSIALVLLLARYVDFSENPWPNRNFNMIERLLTEARIVSEYLFHLFVPRIEGNGLYQDGYVISKGLFQPVTTVLAIGFLSVLTALAIMLRKSFPVITLAILFFMAAHLMESTVIGLELYFEHRNYLAALFLFLPIAYYSVKMSQRYRTIPLIMACLLILLASMTYLRATLWSDNDQLELYWVQSATDSPRAINSLAAMYMRNNEYEKANALLQEQGERLSHSSLLTARLLLQKVHVGVATEKDFIEAADRLQYQEFDAQTVKGVRTIVESVIDGNNFDYAIYTLKLLDTMNQSSVYNQFPLFVRLQYYLRGQLYRYLEKSKQMLENYSEAIQHYNETDAALAMVAEVASAGYYTEALKLLDQSEQVLAEQSDRSLKRSRVTYEADINNLRQLFNNALEQEASVHED